MQTSEKLYNTAEKLKAAHETLLASLIRNKARQQAEREEYLANKHNECFVCETGQDKCYSILTYA